MMTLHTLLIGLTVLCQLSAFSAAQTKFIVVGDWGDYPDQTNQNSVAQQMGEWSEQNGCDFIISTGDNFYPKGVPFNQSDRFDFSWRLVYNHSAIKDLDWYISVGNHDHGPDFRELYQVEFSEYEPRWKMPYLWYSFQMTGESTMDFLVIDTQALANRDEYDNAEQLGWLEGELASSTADWIFVVGHHPAVSAGFAWGEEIIFEEVLPLLEQYGADFFIAGHDHNLQHIIEAENEAGGIDYVISGSGSQTNGYREESDQIITDLGYQLQHFSESLGFATFEVDDSSALVTFHDHDGYVLYDFVRTKD